jgi:hypothetical protein
MSLHAPTRPARNLVWLADIGLDDGQQVDIADALGEVTEGKRIVQVKALEF